jgi:hypothetical protein
MACRLWLYWARSQAWAASPSVVALLVRPLIDRVSSVPAAQRAPLLRLVAMGAFGLGALGIVAWLISDLQATSPRAAAG